MRRLPLTRCTVLARPRKGRSTTISDLCAASGGLGEWPLYDVQHALVKRGWGTAIAALLSFKRLCRNSAVGPLRPAANSVSKTVVQRLPSVAAGRQVHGAWHDAVIHLLRIASASITGIVELQSSSVAGRR